MSWDNTGRSCVDADSREQALVLSRVHWHRRAVRSLVLILLASATATVAWAADDAGSAVPTQDMGPGLYDRFCLACHGADGTGRGPGAVVIWPPPRDFSTGDYKWRSTSSGKPPTDLDLERAIRFGVPGTSMHAFGPSLNANEVDALVAHLKTFAPRKFRRDATPLSLPPAQERKADLARGEALFTTAGCIKCHGPEGKGDGPSSTELKDASGRLSPPYDLNTIALRRPHAPDSDPVADIYMSLLTGLSGSPMPAYEGAVPTADLWAIASFVQSIRAPEPKPGMNRSSEIPLLARNEDRDKGLMRAGYYPGHGSELDRGIFGGAIMPQGAPAPSQTPAQASIDAQQCARCHNSQYRDWQSSLHGKAGSPGLVAQLLAMERRAKSPTTTAVQKRRNWASLESCQRCHNPLPEQTPVLSAAQSGAAGYQPNPNYSSALRDQGLNCASCHVRKGRRFGPPSSNDNKRLGLTSYVSTSMELYERSDFCMQCHQLSSRAALNGKPLLNTYKEWLEGPYMQRGVQCQHCHMPDREHTWKGVHDPETFRQGIKLETITGRSKGGTVSVRARLVNVGAGHYLPTTPTPAAWISIQLVDEDGEEIDGAYAEKRIGRHLAYQGGWKELEDTRIPPGESLELAAAWKLGRVSKAVAAQIAVRVEPDEYYERLYRRQLTNKNLPAVERRMFLEALQATQDSQYVALRRRVNIEK